MQKAIFIVTALTAAALLGACGGKSSTVAAAADSVETSITVPVFNADSAYRNVAAQVVLGPRVPGTDAHKRCISLITDRMRETGADTVFTQQGMMTDAKGNPVKINNIMARFNTSAPKRLLLLAHYDTRPWADAEEDKNLHSQPIPGANDGGSGVGVLLEIGRLVGRSAPAVGVDLLFVDAEDMGVSDDSDPASDLTWCLGSQYFAEHLPYPPSQRPVAAILLDMVGGKDAVFPYEYFSYNGARRLAEDIWTTAANCGQGERFIRQVGGAVNDDHVHILGAGIPTVDIIEIGHADTQSFNPTWHTLNDNMDNIDPATLGAVGQVVTTFIYNYK